MKVLVLGARGMLGRSVMHIARLKGFDVHTDHVGYDVTSMGDMIALRTVTHPNVVINCTGIIPARQGDRRAIEMVRVNAYGPWVVREVFASANIIHVSTDCVFSGQTLGLKCDADLPDSRDLYGRSKLMGEVPGTVVVRTSFIGHKHGLLRWFLDLPEGAHVKGWSRAHWSGGTVYDVADALLQRLNAKPGVYHLAAPTITKYHLLVALRDLYDKNITIDVDTKVEINRGLYPSDGWAFSRNLDTLSGLVAA